MQKETLTEKLQVLLSKNDVQTLNTIIAIRAVQTGEKPVPVSFYIRELIKRNIEENLPEQYSFVGEKVKQIITNYKQEQDGKQ
jgi:hypothetical protein